MTWQTAEDLADVADGLEGVTLARRDGAQTAVPQALRRRVGQREAQTSNGRYTRADVKWHLPLATLPAAPQVGDAIVDSHGTAWTILQVDQDATAGRWRCWCRRLALAPGLTDRVTLQRATWTKDAQGAATASWSDVQTQLAARIQPLRGGVEMEHDRRLNRASHRVFLASAVPLDEHHRLLHPHRGQVYYLVRWEGTERLDALLAVDVVQSPWLLG
jgi:head-tail adaptor